MVFSLGIEAFILSISVFVVCSHVSCLKKCHVGRLERDEEETHDLKYLR